MKQRAIGSLLHLVQDSFTESHTCRNKKNQIEYFQLYLEQDSTKHTEKDIIKEGELWNRIVKHTSKILLFYSKEEKWEHVKDYLLKRVFVVSKKPKSARSHPDLMPKKE